MIQPGKSKKELAPNVIITIDGTAIKPTQQIRVLGLLLQSDGKAHAAVTKIKAATEQILKIDEDTELGGEDQDGISGQARLPEQSVVRNPVKLPGGRSVEPSRTSTGSLSSVPEVTPPTMPPTGSQPDTSGRHTVTAPFTTTATSTPSRPSVGSPFVCTVSTLYHTFVLRPLDGVCSVLFYDSLYKEKASKLPVEKNSKAEHFLQLTAHMTQTKIGMSFKVEYSDLEHEYETRAFDAGLDQLLRQNISHVGILNASLNYTRTGNITLALKVLKKIDIYLKTKDANRRVFTSLGIIPDNPFFRLYGDLMLQIFIPDVFVAIGHISFPDNELHNCRIMPPTISQLPPSFHLPYGYTLNDSIDLLRQIARVTSYSYLALSFDLPARLYYYIYDTAMTSTGTGGAGPFTPCNMSQYQQSRSPASMCPSSGNRDWDNYRYNNDLHVSLTYNPKEKQTLTFDSERALRAKVCETKENALTVTYGLAAYNIDYDTYSRACPELTITGPYERVKLLGRLHAFLLAHYKIAAQKSACTVLT
ncbi:uncharacterized protein LOC144108720 [Amblyomma americanum]